MQQWKEKEEDDEVEEEEEEEEDVGKGGYSKSQGEGRLIEMRKKKSSPYDLNFPDSPKLESGVKRSSLQILP